VVARSLLRSGDRIKDRARRSRPAIARGDPASRHSSCRMSRSCSLRRAARSSAAGRGRGERREGGRSLPWLDSAAAEAVRRWRFDPDPSGGSLLYLTPRLLASLGRGLVLRAGVQIPVARNLNGYQTERAVANVGLTYVLSR
jgi:hypothetical protein